MGDLPPRDRSEGAELYHLIAEGIPNMVWTARADGGLDYFNRRVFEYTGRSAKELGDWGWRDLIHPEDWPMCEARWRRSIETGEDYEVEYRFRRGSDSSYRWHLGAALPLRHADGSVAKWFGTCTDIDDQKRADTTQKRNAQKQLERYSERVKQLLYRLVDTQETERRNIASSLHDLIGQKLTALNIGLDILKRDLHATAGAHVRSRLESMGTLVDETVESIRGVMQDLRPSELEDFGLVPALHSHARRFEEQTGIRTTVDAAEPFRRLPRNVELALFRVAQEALTNAVKHSGATSIRMHAWQEAGRSSLSIEDDGRGFSDPQGARSVWRGGWGLPEMRKRAEAVGGQLQIEFPATGGTRVLVHVGGGHAD